MSVYNTLTTEAKRPHCRSVAEVRADFRFGLRDQLEYSLGDTLIWEGKGIRTPSRRPPNGDYQGEAYTECPVCGKPYWLLVRVRGDILAEAVTDWDHEDYAGE